MNIFSKSLNERIINYLWKSDNYNFINYMLTIRNKALDKYYDLLLSNVGSAAFISKGTDPYKITDYSYLNTTGWKYTDLGTLAQHIRALARNSLPEFEKVITKFLTTTDLEDEINGLKKTITTLSEEKDDDIKEIEEIRKTIEKKEWEIKKKNSNANYTTAKFLVPLLLHLISDRNLKALEIIFERDNIDLLRGIYKTAKDDGANLIYTAYTQHMEAVGENNRQKEELTLCILGICILINYNKLRDPLSTIKQTIMEIMRDTERDKAPFARTPFSIIEEMLNKEKDFSDRDTRSFSISLKELAKYILSGHYFVGKAVTEDEIEKNLAKAVTAYFTSSTEVQTTSQLEKLYLNPTVLCCYLMKPCILLTATTIGAGLIGGSTIVAAVITSTAIGSAMASMYKTDILFAAMVEQFAHDATKGLWSNYVTQPREADSIIIR